MWRRCIDHGEALLKGLLFDCQRCGQCVLRSTAMRCPMRCPKGMRNGPCGGTVDGRCEVHPERPCRWLIIDARRHGQRLQTPPILPPVRADLCGRASIANALSGRDAGCRTPLPALGGDDQVLQQRCRTDSRLEAALRSRRFVVTVETHAGKSLQPQTWARCDAVNATAFLAGRASLPSIDVAASVQAAGHEAVAQVTGRDVTRTTFRADLLRLQKEGINNLLCLTGDRGDPRDRAVFAFDAALLVYEARHLREHGRFLDDERRPAAPPRPFLGVACNPATTPVATVIRRMLQKAAAGAEFVQSQPLFDRARWRPFWQSWCEAGLQRRLFFLAGVPLVTSKTALARLRHIPGLVLPPAIDKRLAAADDLPAAGLALARELVDELTACAGVHGVHILCFGPAGCALPTLLDHFDNRTQTAKGTLCTTS